ncbi:hypothetical protein HanIR_Chr08g0347911 [Helianthus annuus]|nr:hypothetical protein HanIR_Chr08g0347911 [Helianthus annuus]
MLNINPCSQSMPTRLGEARKDRLECNKARKAPEPKDEHLVSGTGQLLYR